MPRLRHLRAARHRLARRLRGRDYAVLRTHTAPPFVQRVRPAAHTHFTHRTQRYLYEMAHHGLGLPRNERRRLLNRVAADYRRHVRAGTHRDHPLRTGRGRARLFREARSRYRANRPLARRLLTKSWRIALLLLLAAVPVSMLAGLLLDPRRNPAPFAEQHRQVDAIPVNQRAWPAYRDALLALPAGIDLYDDLPDTGSHPVDPHWPTTRRALRRLEPALDALREAGRRPHFGWPVATIDDPLDERPFFRRFAPDFDNHDATGILNLHGDLAAVALHAPTGLTGRAHRLLRLDTLAAAERGDPARVVANVQTLLSLADHLEQVPVYFNLLKADGLRAAAFDLLTEIVADAPELFDAEALAALADLGTDLGPAPRTTAADLLRDTRVRIDRHFFRRGWLDSDGLLLSWDLARRWIDPDDWASYPTRRDRLRAALLMPLVVALTPREPRLLAALDRLSRDLDHELSRSAAGTTPT